MRSHQGDFLKGTVIGGVLGSIVGLLVAPKSGKELREDICDGYDCVCEKTQEFSDEIKEKSCHLLHAFKREEEEDNDYNSLLLGGSIGVVIGTIAALLLAPQSGNKMRESIGDKYEEIYDKAEDFVTSVNKQGSQVLHKLDDWKDTLVLLADKLTSAKGRGRSKAKEIADWAGLGIRLFQQMQKRR